MGDFTPFVKADATDVTAPVIERYEPFSMQGGFSFFGVNWLQSKNVTSWVESSDTGEDGEWKQIYGYDVVAGENKNSVTFGALAANHLIVYQNAAKYYRIAGDYTNSDNRLLAMIART
jgi:hypothetical protein